MLFSSLSSFIILVIFFHHFGLFFIMSAIMLSFRILLYHFHFGIMLFIIILPLLLFIKTSSLWHHFVIGDSIHDFGSLIWFWSTWFVDWQEYNSPISCKGKNSVFMVFYFFYRLKYLLKSTLAPYNFKFRNRSAFAITETELKLIAMQQSSVKVKDQKDIKLPQSVPSTL
jgi:hypothetical protein